VSDAQALLADFTRRGFKLTPNPSKIGVQPASKLTDADRQVLRANKPALLAALAARDATTQVKTVFPKAQLVGVREVNGAAAVAVEPANEPEPAEAADPRNDPRIDPTIRCEIERWEPQLIALGWALERIWNSEFWPHTAEQPRGLASVLQRGDRIRFADNHHAHIIKCDGSQQRFPKDG
jgi:hypothetical protein